MTILNNVPRITAYKLSLRQKTVFSVLCVIVSLNFFVVTVFANTSADTTVSVKINICGNAVKEAGEDCDNGDLGGQTCQSRGFSGGSLMCNTGCTFNISGCTSGGGGGGGALNPLVKPNPLSLEAQKADVNKDNKIDIFDFNILMADWGAIGPDMADLNGDNMVDIFDLNFLMIYWTG